MNRAAINRMTPMGAALLALAVLAAAISCEQEPQQHSRGDAAGKLTVAVSIVPQAWLVETIGGAHVEVVTLVSPGDSPATYLPSDAQISQLMRATVYFRIGVPFENGRWFQALRQVRTLHVVDTRKGITLRRMTTRRGHDEAHDHGGDDPHIWLSPALLETQAVTVATALCQLDPDHQTAYRANLAAVRATLEATDRAIRDRLEPIRGRAFLVFHPSWGYFADAYGLEQIAIESAGKAPSDHELTAVAAAARRGGIKVVFVQPQIEGNAARAVAQSIDGRVAELDPLAPDVPRNLLHVAEVLVDSYR